MEKLPWKHIHFTGIGGVGMSGLAHIVMDFGVIVSGTDMVNSSSLEDLNCRGAKVSAPHSAKDLPGTDLLVYSSAVPDSNPELVYARENNIPTMLRGKFLAELSSYFDTVIAVSGSHGKTTTTAMLTTILQLNNLKPGFMVGGDLPGFTRAATAGNGTILVTEVDESDGTQAYMHPTCSIILNIEDDHAWSVGGQDALENNFVQLADQSKSVIAWKTEDTTRILAKSTSPVNFINSFTDNMELQVPGEYHKQNATLALTAANQILKIPVQSSLDALKNYTGVKRRMTTHFATPEKRVMIIEDYAHHPTELKATLTALKNKYPEHNLHIIFQPHRFERIKKYASEFADILDKVDNPYIYSPFAAWKTDSHIADAQMILDHMKNPNSYYHKGSLPELASYISKSWSEHGKSLYAVIGAGDIRDIIKPLKETFTNFELEKAKQVINAYIPGINISSNIPWSNITSLKVGKASPLLANPKNINELKKLLQISNKINFPYRIIGYGTNLIGSDETTLSLVIRPDFKDLKLKGNSVSVGCSYPLPKFIKELAQAEVLPEKAAPLFWIPASIGGAVKMNAGAGGTTICQYITKITGINATSLEIESISGHELNPAYRTMNLPENFIITEIDFHFPESCDAELALEAINESGEFRKSTQPQGYSAGCIFRNPAGNHAGKLIDLAGCKNHRQGGCVVSDKHANFIINDKEASEKDILQLILYVQKEVFRNFNVILAPEVEFSSETSTNELNRRIKLITGKI